MSASGGEGSDATYDLRLLERSEAKWRESGGLRAVYQDLFRRMRAEAAPGPALEIGSGIGSLRSVVPDVVTSDILKTPYVDLAVSAYALEEAGRDWGTIYAFDVLHHLREPLRFLASAARSLRPGGRLVLMEPAATPLGRWFYRAVHPEPIDPSRVTPPYVFPPDDASGAFANMGMGWALWVRDGSVLGPRLAAEGMHLRRLWFGSGLAYAATGGLSRPQLLPTPALRALLRFEAALPPAWWRLTGLRMMIVLERRPGAPAS